jgi:hypothetical protein
MINGNTNENFSIQAKLFIDEAVFIFCLKQNPVAIPTISPLLCAIVVEKMCVLCGSL